ncbi:MAG: 2-isopropylmalate synthase, partial [Micrococcales bacterium]|nr:2-isopropylmalate synthase [Micrococcales bacterium]
GGEVTPAQLWRTFQDEYLPNSDAPWGRFQLVNVVTDSTVDGASTIEATLTDNGQGVTITGTGNGPIAAFCDALQSIEDGPDVRVLDYAEHAMSAGGDATAAAYVETAVGDRVLWGVGIDPSIVTASLKAIVSASNRAVRDRATERQSSQPSPV